MSWLKEMQSLLPPERFSRRRADREAASRDESTLPGVMPDAVAWPVVTDEVADLMTVANAHGVAVTARGAGTGLEGNCIPVHGGLVVDLSRMNRIVSVEPDDLLARVQPGVVYADLNREIRNHGLFFPPHPGGSADTATVGGMAATNASGIYSVKYGGTRDYVRAATVVTGTGMVVRLGSPCRKTSSGYHLIGLVVGSEGTLAIATEITLALAPLPQARRRGAFAFSDERAAAAAIADMMRYGLAPAAVEFLDSRCVQAVNDFLSTTVPLQPLVLIEADGAEIEVPERWSAISAHCAERGGAPLDEAAWDVRAHVTRAIQRSRPGASLVRTDLAFPVSRLPEMISRSHDLARTRATAIYTFGHAGLGILHALIPADPGETVAWAKAAALKDDIVALALELGGSVSGEHGLGLGNRRYAALEHGAALDLMRAIKAAFDPKGILNPGKIWG